MNDRAEREVRKLLDEGKVTSEEADQLLGAIRGDALAGSEELGLVHVGKPEETGQHGLPDRGPAFLSVDRTGKGLGLIFGGGLIGAGLAVGLVGLVLFGLGIALIGLAVCVVLFPFALVGGRIATRLRSRDATVAAGRRTRRLERRRSLPQKPAQIRRLDDGTPGRNGNPEDA